jgi:ABC-2 type transport system permease protein
VSAPRVAGAVTGTGSARTAVAAHVELPGVTLPRVIRSEWTKLRTLRSTAWALLVTLALVVGVGIMVCVFRVANWPPRDPGGAVGFDPAAASLSGIYLAEIGIGVLGALVFTGEYATRLIQTTFSTVPRRLTAMTGKAVAFGAAALAIGLVGCVATFLIGQSILDSKGIGTTLDQPGVARAVLGSALFLVVVGLLGLGLGALLRSTAAAVGTLVGLLLVLPILVGFLPSGVADQVGKFLPMAAGTAISNLHPGPDVLSPWTGLGLFTAYTAVVLALAAHRLVARDAR